MLKTKTIIALFSLIFITKYVSSAEDYPRQVHIAYGSGLDMTISFNTKYKSLYTLVTYYETNNINKNDNDMKTVYGSSSSYYESYDHHTTLQGLKADTEYTYMCGIQNASSDAIYTKQFTFYTKRQNDITHTNNNNNNNNNNINNKIKNLKSSESNNIYPLNIGILGDLGIYNSDKTFSLLRKLKSEEKFDMILHIGDISYADDAFLHHPFDFYYESFWNSYMDQIADIASEIPYMVLPGNHEAECHSPVCQVDQDKLMHLSNFSAFNSRFKMPYEDCGGALNMWYSFDYGPVHFTNIDTETDWPGNEHNDHFTLYKPGNGGFGDQVTWVNNDIKQASSRGVYDWIIVSGHKPMYSIAKCNDDGTLTDYALDMQTTYEDLFYDYNVDVYFSGHKHSAERSLPVYNNTVEIDEDGNALAPLYVVNGAGGNSEGLGDYSNQPRPSWYSWSDDTDYGVGVFTILSETEAQWQFYSSDDGEIMDDYILKKEKK